MLRANGIMTPACPSLYLPRLAPLKPAQPPSGAYQNQRLMKPADYYSLSLPSIYTRTRGKPPSRFPTPRKARSSRICRPPSHTTQTPAPCRLPPQSAIPPSTSRRRCRRVKLERKPSRPDRRYMSHPLVDAGGEKACDVEPVRLGRVFSHLLLVMAAFPRW